jgi:hypothetical protein
MSRLRRLMLRLALLSHETSEALIEACTVERRRSLRILDGAVSGA